MTNKASDYKTMVFGTTIGNREIGKGLIIYVHVVVIRADDPKESMGFTSPEKIAEYLGRASSPLGKDGVKVVFEEVTAMEVDAEYSRRKLVHGKTTDEGEIKFSQSPTDSKERKAIVVIMD
jgi:hypothetical protein